MGDGVGGVAARHGGGVVGWQEVVSLGEVLRGGRSSGRLLVRMWGKVHKEGKAAKTLWTKARISYVVVQA